MRAAQIAREINRQGLYQRRDGQPLPAYQVSSIAHSNRGRFRIVDGVIALQSRESATSGSPSTARGSECVDRVASRKRADDTSRVILLGSVKQKFEHPAAAKDLYRSPLWKARRTYAEASGYEWLILSAKHGVLEPDQRIAPYDVELRKLSATERHRWGERTVKALHQRLTSLKGVTFEVHAGDAYRRAIEPGILQLGAKLDAPLAHLTIGKQSGWYRSQRFRGATAS